MRKIAFTVIALASLISGAPATPAAAAPTGQAALAAILAMPESTAVENVQYYGREARFRARQAARRRAFRRRQAIRRGYRY